MDAHFSGGHLEGGLRFIDLQDQGLPQRKLDQRLLTNVRGDDYVLWRRLLRLLLSRSRRDQDHGGSEEDR